jgi:hypothetical protein
LNQLVKIFQPYHETANYAESWLNGEYPDAADDYSVPLLSVRALQKNTRTMTKYGGDPTNWFKFQHEVFERVFIYKFSNKQIVDQIVAATKGIEPCTELETYLSGDLVNSMVLNIES